MGVEWGDQDIVIKPFLETTTFRNLRDTTAAPVSRRFRKVVVSRNGLITMSWSPHSTPIGAKLGVPAPSSVVRIDSMITGPARRAAARTPVAARARGRSPRRLGPGAGAAAWRPRAGSDRAGDSRARSAPIPDETAGRSPGAARAPPP